MNPTQLRSRGHLRLVAGGEPVREAGVLALPPAAPPPPADLLRHIESTVTDWLDDNHLRDHDGLSGALAGLLAEVNSLQAPYIDAVSEEAREFLHLARGAGLPPDADHDLAWGAREFLRLAELAAKVTPLPERP